MKLVESYELSKADFFDLNVIYVNMLLASELYLKCILLKNGIEKTRLKKIGHNLLMLYQNLSINKQSKIKNRFKCFYGVDDLDTDFLVKVKNDFVNCRYMFVEGKESNYKLLFNNVKSFMYEVQYMASRDLYGIDTYKILS